jgi:acetyltransferase-like isoleucine patch superfamily enzyme
MPRTFIPDDWFGRGIPDTVRLGADVYLDGSYGFDGVVSRKQPAVSLGDATGAYNRASFLVGPRGRVVVGEYSVLNGCYLISEESITIGDHCLLAWGAVITDTWPGAAPIETRRALLRAASTDTDRWPGAGARPLPVTLGDNVWIGFDAVVMPGVTIGRGAVVSSRSVVTTPVPPYAIVVGNPGRIVRYLDPDDTEDARRKALAEYSTVSRG